MQELVEYLVSSLVEHPEAIEIVETNEEDAVTYRVKVHADDIGRIIGRQGRIAKAIRNVVSAAAYRQGKRVFVDIQS
ncbi:KH domain-containing protein [Alicyclobacillus dauci]|uniref:RNA-binding protein KhpA n=1 Tax=Alicyclobacillus dauci TaxID=1475485 RepID=A0ABY6YZB7_9BACL|nr:KH domain-containing protein [Alicyclobacillus dauci]WAH35466.1 KH domain-containing protein [Alicyclobacillus dauci]